MKKIIIFILCVFLASLTLKAQVTDYKIMNKFKVGGTGGWDYISVDDNTDRLFVSHGMVVNVVDAKTGSLLGTINDTKGVHGIAIAASLNKGFISCGRDTSVVVFDLKTLEVKEIVKVTGVNPDAILYDEFSNKVFVYNGRTANATVLDAVSNKVIETIPLKGKPEFSVTNGKGLVYVNIEDKNLMTVINANTLKVENEWSLSPGEEPSGLAMDIINNRLFSVCGNKIMTVMDAVTGKLITTVPIGDGCDGVDFDSNLKRIYASNGEGTMTIIQQEGADSYKVLGNLETQKSARTVCVSLKTNHIYSPAAEFDPPPDPTPENQHPRPKIKPDTFVILDIGIVK